MSYRRRSKDITTPVAQLAALVVLALVFIPQVRTYTLVLLVVGAGVGLGLLLYRSNSRRSADRNVFGHRLDASISPALAAPASAIFRPLQAEDIVARLRSIDWFQFEKVIAAVYKNLGYVVTRRGGANPDGGIDLVLDKGAERVAVQCKQWRTWKVRERTVREFLGALTHARIPKGILVTLCGYTNDAQRLANAHGIEIVTETGLTKLLTDAKAEHSPEVLAALRDDQKVCPKCESEMLLRTARKGGSASSQFWGCSTYPRCRYTMSVG
jgi:hypothetical protein